VTRVDFLEEDALLRGYVFARMVRLCDLAIKTHKSFIFTDPALVSSSYSTLSLF
jgi:hypothetical protein